MDPEIPRPSEPGLGRLLRRRSRAKRLSRSYQGKVFKSWGEYAPMALQTTGDHSSASGWGYIAIFCGAVLIVPLLIGLLVLDSPPMESEPLGRKAMWLLELLRPLLTIDGILLFAVVAHRRWSRLRT